jgi:hypothetical protein
VTGGRLVVDADLPVDPPVELGSTQAYALCTVKNYVMMAIHAGCSEDQVFGVVVDGIHRAMAARLPRLAVHELPARPAPWGAPTSCVIRPGCGASPARPSRR